jgi:regulator of sigma E protease
MNALSVAGGFVGSMGWYIVPFIVVLSVVVFFHELGHYLVGRWCGVQIDRFSLGFGPELFAWVDKRGTRWRIAAFPLGGYVKFHGDADVSSAPDAAALARMDNSERRLTLAGQPVLNRAAIVAAGPIANFILAMVIFTVSLALSGQYILTPRVGGVEVGSPADLAGFQKGDLIKTANGNPVDSFEDLHQAISTNTGLTIVFGLERAGQAMTIAAAPSVALVDLGALGKRRMGRLGIKASTDPADSRLETCGLPRCIAWAAKDTWSIVDTTSAYVVGLFAGRESADQVSGAIGVAQIAGQIAKINIFALFSLTAVFSVSVGLMNLLPVPLLDGGHLLFYAIEALRGRPLSERTQEIGLRIGIALVAMLVIFSTSHDILRLVTGGGG